MEVTTDRHLNQAAPALFLLLIGYLGFISLGLPDSIAGVAWPSVRTHFSLHQSQFGLVFIGMSCGYCISGIFGGKLTLSMGLGNLLWVSSGLVTIALFGFSVSPTWPLFVGCAVVWGLGSGGIDTGLNAYSSHHFPARHVNWMHACYSIGATIGPLIMTAMLYLSSWRIGYGFVGSLLCGMTVTFLITRASWMDDSESERADNAARIGMTTILREPLVWLQMALFLIYVGLEFTIGQWCFTILTESRKVPNDVAGSLASGYYASIGIGRIIAGVVAPRLGLDSLLRIAMITTTTGTVLFALGAPVAVSSIGLLIIGLGLAPMFPCFMARTPQRLGPDYAIHAVGFQASCGAIGGALMPGTAGILSDQFSLEFISYFGIILAIILLTLHEVILSRPPVRRREAQK